MDELPPIVRQILLGLALFVGLGLIGLSGLILWRSPWDEDSIGDRSVSTPSAPTASPGELPPPAETAALDDNTASPEGKTSFEVDGADADVDQAISQYRSEILQDREAILPRLNLGAALMQKGRVQEALAEYEQARRMDDTVPELHYNLGNAYSQIGRPADAIAAYQRAILLRPDYANAHYNLGNSLLELGQRGDAEEAYRAAIANNDQLAEAYGNLGILLSQRQAYDEARETLIQAQMLLKQQGKTTQLTQVESTLRQLPQ